MVALLCQDDGMRDPLEGRSVDGMIVTGVAAERVPEAFRVVLTDASEAVTAAAPNSSLYLYGSVATGQAEVGRSDLDLLALGLDAEGAAMISSELTARFADRCREAAIGAAAPPDFVGDHDEAYGNRVFLRHYCVLVTGSDVHRPDHDFPADARAARGFNGDVARHLDRWHGELSTSTDPAVIAMRVARKTLLAVAGLVSVHDETWTTDRALAAARWSEIEPQRSAGLATLLRWTDGALTVDRTDVARTLDHLVDPLVHRFAADIGIWPDP